MTFLKKTVLTSLLVLCAGVVCGEKPNFLFIIADDCTYRDLGCYGGQAHTPNMNKLVTQGMKFNRCFQTSPMCSPTRHTIYTGLYPVKSGAYTNHSHAYDGVKSVVQYLKPLGYRVALSGKSHVAPVEVFPFERSQVRPKKKDRKIPPPSVIDFEAVDKLMKESVEAGTPFALFACSNEPHEPWNKGVEYRKLYNADDIKLRPYMVDTKQTREEYVEYLGEITFFDNEVGQLLDLLEKHDLSDNTLVMVVSEQGNVFPFAKWSCYDSGLQSGMIVRWPGKVKAGSETDAMVEYVDVVPTFVEAAGGTPARKLDGKSLLPVLSGKTNEHKEYVYGLQTSRGIYHGPHHYGIRSVRDDQFKLIWNLDSGAEFQNYARNKKWFATWKERAEAGDEHAAWVLNRYASRPELELYDITADPFEINNLAQNPEYAGTIMRLKKQLDSWMASQGDKGQETELAAFERMLSGNDEYKAWAKANGNPNADKKGEDY
ncbi:MAG: sulfatase [Puniceicoccaceae bacterium]